MTPDHPRWAEFERRLGGPEGCNFSDDGEGPNREGSVHWRCGRDTGSDHLYSAEILRAMGFSPDEIESSLAHFGEQGGYCDCEILFNVATPAAA